MVSLIFGSISLWTIEVKNIMHKKTKKISQKDLKLIIIKNICEEKIYI